MEQEFFTTILRLSLAVMAGGLIGFERTYHGRPAGFRTHTLVCTASSLLMLLTVFQWQLIGDEYLDTVRVDPTRMAQGIMTGIGFLGAGVIIKEKLTVRGLTTAASIWLTASIGIVIGMGLYFAAMAATLFGLGILILFRWIENTIPTLRYGQLSVRFTNDNTLNEQEIRDLIKKHNFTYSKLSYHLENKGKIIEYKMTIRTNKMDNYKLLAETLTSMDRAIEFSLIPTSD